MIVTKKMVKYLAGNTEGMSQKDINWCALMVRVHQPPIIKIDGTIVGVVTSMDIKLNREEFKDIPPYKGKFDFTSDITDFKIDQEFLDKITKDDEHEDSN